MKINKLYIVCIDYNKALEFAKHFIERNNKDEYKIACTFSTGQDYADVDSSDKYMYYVSEEQLNLDFKNNALLYVLTNSDTQESIGISLEEYWDENKLIPLSIKAFNCVKKDYLENSLIVWLDIYMNKLEYSKIDYHINMIESNYLMKNIPNIKDQFLYFSNKEDIKDAVSTALDFVYGDEKTRNEILEENC